MREVLPSFNNLQQNILEALQSDPLECLPSVGKPWDKKDGHLQKLIERGFVQELPNGNYTLVTDIYGDSLFDQLQWVVDL